MSRIPHQSDLIEIHAKLLIETERAYRITDGDKTVWVPKSIVEYDGDGVFTMPEWIARDTGLI